MKMISKLGKFQKYLLICSYKAKKKYNFNI